MILTQFKLNSPSGGGKQHQKIVLTKYCDIENE